MLVPLYGLHIAGPKIPLGNATNVFSSDAVQCTIDELLPNQGSIHSFLETHPADSFLLIEVNSEIRFAQPDEGKPSMESIAQSCFPAIQKTERLLQTLRLYKEGRFTHGGFWILCRWKLGEPVRKNDLLIDDLSVELQLTPPGLTLGSLTRAQRGGYGLTELEGKFFSEFEERLGPELDRAELAPNFKTALRFFGESYEHREEEFNIVFLIIALEALLSDPPSESPKDTKDQVRTRFCRLLGQATFDGGFNKFYKLRNHLMHGTALTEWDKNVVAEVSTFRENVRRILLSCVALNSLQREDYRLLIDKSSATELRGLVSLLLPALSLRIASNSNR